jgi:hypothetical protein
MAQRPVQVRPQSQFHSAPPPLDEWVGRSELLEGLKRDYADPQRRVTGLIGFGGEEKSSLARGRWIAQSHGRDGSRTRLDEGDHKGAPLQQAFSDLREALGYAMDGGYCISGQLGTSTTPKPSPPTALFPG